MSEPKLVAERAVVEIEDLLADMFDSGAPNNHILLGSLATESGEVIQVQLVVTRDIAEFVDENC